MLKNVSALVLHLVMLAIVCAIAAYWTLKIATPPPSAAPPPVAAPAPREADPILAARMFGLVQAAPVVASNIQLVGVFSAGKDSSAIVAVDGKPARVVLLGQTVSAGAKLVEVRRDGVTLDNNGARQELRLPLRSPVAVGGAPPPPAGFARDGNTLTAPGLSGPTVPAPGLPTPGIPAPGAQMRPVQPLQPPLQPQSDPPNPQSPPATRSTPMQ
jgi:general secretion pathway protein C